MSGLTDIAITVNALGWTLVHFLWQGALVAVFMSMIFVLIPPRHSRQRYLAGLALYFLLLPVAINTFLFFLESSSIKSEILPGEFPMVSVTSGVKPDLGFWLNEGIEPMLPLIVILWTLGVALLGLKTVFAWVGTRRLVRTDVAAVASGLQKRIDRLVKRFRVRQSVTVLVSTRVIVPTVIGWIKPVILIPAGVLARLPVQQLEMVIAHELAHIRRYDYLVNLLQVVIDTLFFYHPAVRWMSRKIRQEREHCCDDFVLGHQCRPALYARALANLEFLRRPPDTTAVAATGGDLLHRVHRIASKKVPRKSAGFAQLVMMTVLVAVAAVGAKGGLEISTFSPVAAPDSGSLKGQTIFAGPFSSSRDHWMNQFDLYDRIRLGLENNSSDSIAAGQSLLSREVGSSEASLPVVVNAAKQKPSIVKANDGAFQLEKKPRNPQHAGLQHNLPMQVDMPKTDVDTGFTESDMNATKLIKKARKKATVKPVKTVNPKYPSYARSRAVEGWVKLTFTVDKRGRAKAITVVDSSPEQVFDRAAEKALRKWKFEVLPGHNTDRPLVQTFDFSLHPSDDRQSSRNRRCNTTGSNICGMFYRQETVEKYGPQAVRMEASNKK